MEHRSAEFPGGESREEDEEDEETRATNRKVEMRKRQDELQEKGKRKDLLRLVMSERSRAEREDIIRRDREARERKMLLAQRDEKLGLELLRRKNAETAEEKRRQALRRDSIDLRRLESQLRISQADEAMRSQLLERKILRENTRIRETEDARRIQAWYRNDSFEKQRMLEAREKKDQYRRDLHAQLESNRRRLRQQKSEESEREREITERASELLRAENLDSQRRKRETAARLRDEEREFLRASEHSRLADERQRRLATEADETDQPGRVSHLVKAAATAATKAKTLKEATEKMMNDEARKREREDALTELTARDEERSERESAERRAAAEKEARIKELREDMRVEKLAIEERRASEAEADRAFADYLARQRRESAAADKRKDEERRARGVEYAKALREAAATRSIGYAAKILERQTMLNCCERKLDEARGISIEEERSRMLVEHERRFQGFPKLEG